MIVSDWDDGHREPAGILTSRIAALHAGRPLWVSASVEHRWSGVHRSLELTRIDDCDAISLATASDVDSLQRAHSVLDREARQAR